MTAEEWLARLDDKRTAWQRAQDGFRREQERFQKEQEAAAAWDEDREAQRELMALLGRPYRGD